MVVTVKRIGGSLAVVIPRAFALESGLSEGVSLDVRHAPGGILMRQPGRRGRRRIGQIVKKMSLASYKKRADETNDVAVGKEIA